jgi:hypothetical protein
MEPIRLKRMRPTEVCRPRCLACNATSRLAPTVDGTAFVCRLARCRDAWIAQRMRVNAAAARASQDAEPPTPATRVATKEAFEAFRWRPDAAPASK